MKVRKAVIPVAGFGTRFLPQTKAMPKEMLPLVDKPIVQYVVEKAVAAGIEQIILVTGWHKRAIEDHFDSHFELEARLEQSGKIKELEEIRRIANLAEFVYVRQKEARGNGDAILTAETVVGNEPFLVFWGDEFMDATPGVAEQLMSAYERTGKTVLGGIVTSDPKDFGKYAYVGGEEEEDLLKISKIIEKPGAGNEPSNLAILAGFLFTPDIFDALRRAGERTKEGEELVYVDGINVMLEEGKSVYAHEIKDYEYFDCGSKIGYLRAVVEMGLRHEDVKEEFKTYLEDLQV